MPFFVDNGLTVRYVALAKHLKLADDATCLVMAGAYASRLNHWMYVALDEGSVITNGNHHEWRMAGDACEVDVIGCAEIAKTIGDEAVVVDLYGTHDVWSVAIDDIGTVIYTEVCQLAQRSSVLAKEGL